MASAMMLKIKPNSKLPLQFLCSPVSALTRPIGPVIQPEVTNVAPQKNSTFPLLVMTQNLFTGEFGFAGVRNGGFGLIGGAVFIRQMGTSRSTRGSASRKKDDDDEDVESFDDDNDEGTVDFDDDDDDGVDAFDEDEVDSEDFEDDEEEEKPERKKRY